ncbi:membrane traffic protein [Lithospermum erythrorhizon]|uniref:Exocyst subunit Exo70 family protein n=1 Tax=Lithospermum erythrorhizon TaxID=34254 RepID=A0AAV3NVK4_LITER
MDKEIENEVLKDDDKNGKENEDQPVSNEGENQENDDIKNDNAGGDTLKEEIQGGNNEGEIGEESSNVANEENVPSSPHDLGKVSEEIDEYISTLSNSSKVEGSSPPEVPLSVEKFTTFIEALIKEYDSKDVPVRWDQLTDEDAATFLIAVDRMVKLLKALSEYSSEDKYPHSINTVGRILQRAMAYLEDEFRGFLEDHKVSEEDQNNNKSESMSKQPSTPSGSNQEGEKSVEGEHDHVDEKNTIFRGYSEETMENLYKLANILMDAGHETECCQIYFFVRRNDLDEKLQKLGFEKRSIDDVQKMHWEALEKDIVSWNETVNQITTIHFINEHKLSATVFKDHPSIAESLFSNLARGIIVQLLIFSEAVAMTKRAAEKLFKYLDIYESLRDLSSKMEGLLAFECSDELKSEALLTKGRLGEAMISIFCELENSIKSDSGRTPVPGGAVHPLTRYTMNYLEYACEYRDTLERVFKEHQKIETSDSTLSSDDCNSSNPSQDQYQNSFNNNNNVKKQQSPFEMQLVNVLDLLHDNIETKSKLYKDIPLSLIFMMNNGRYILQKIKACGPIRGLLNDTWCRKKSSDLRQYHKNYQRETWSKLLNVLINHEGLLVHGKVSKPVLKERFKSFNAMFDEIIRTQTTWVIADEQLQSELRVSISNMVVPAYRSFMGRFSHTFTAGRQTEKYVKFQSEDVEARIEELFDGSASNTGRWRM